MLPIVLHNYYRSSTSYRVRIALAMKGMSFTYVARHIRSGGNRVPDYLAMNPQGLVPTMVWPDGSVLGQSLAIIEFLEEMRPTPALLPADPFGRARVRMLAQMIASDLHPVNNFRILDTLRERYKADDADVADWFASWVRATFDPLETLLSTSPETGTFCHGDTPGLADICLVAQAVNNQRYQIDMAAYPVITRIVDECLKLRPFIDAHPSNQPDAE
ncbi:maleylacetoacetate isomerase [Tianweitania sp. BSSL-BM11]|uniref:Maleylacetoacetate isomerase n=1 Tax=Tianweitania aestuarii TaxID=2814886 RepID=A0ABS5RUP8_9HYPH|nr:maleylacetoacetate isomerase [Tianweitania aestuarii]MBS9720771.1 maleylacetoacetate isomerase [Tianweitania aestuarii]